MVVQSWVRMWLVRTRFRRTTAAGRKAAARAARQALFVAAATVIQKYVRRHLALKKVGSDTSHALFQLSFQHTRSHLQRRNGPAGGNIDSKCASSSDCTLYCVATHSLLLYTGMTSAWQKLPSCVHGQGCGVLPCRLGGSGSVAIGGICLPVPMTCQITSNT